MLARKKRGKANSTATCNEERNNREENYQLADNIKSCANEGKGSNSNIFKVEFEFSLTDIKNWENIIRFMYKPMDPASLGLIRIMFGFLMVLDIPEERGLSNADINWGDPNECRFPLFNFLQPLPLQWMCIVYLIMWIGAFGIMLGWYFRFSCLAFIIPYWYIFLLDKTSWNNHSYLYGVISILLLGSQANCYWSLDILLGRVKENTPVPLWNYFILRFQIFLLYFYAGLKKMDKDWLEGYSMRYLSNHWVFGPFKLFLTTEQVDFWIIHLNGFALDLSVGFLLIYKKTRPMALFVLGLFHIMNSRLFNIGMFPYVCIATMPIFCNADWPHKILKLFSLPKSATDDAKQDVRNTSAQLSVKENKIGQSIKKLQDGRRDTFTIGWKHKLITCLLISHTGLQIFLPYSHFITKAWVQTDRWEKHADMVVQYAQCLKRNLMKAESMDSNRLSGNISIHVDVWCSLNGRFQQRMFDPRVDLLTADWSPVKAVTWLMPLLTEFSSWRTQIMDIQREVYSWSEYSDAIFVADFPGLTLENYIGEDLTNITLTVLEGEVIVEAGDNVTDKHKQGRGNKILRQKISKGESMGVPARLFHRVHTVSATPSCYMYSYVNHTRQLQEEQGDTPVADVEHKSRGLWREFTFRLENMARAVGLVSNAILNILYSVPMVKRVRLV
ncbi:vitamin K-dependent gamma-carboxylase isoform X2 [Periplaneta americana]|uniref:vitamin K-dependent gamma-carboxylase isoform X2 n=1 Tax=Periplaneta americana TaxID=6978 RepID=UPI0037E6FC59